MSTTLPFSVIIDTDPGVDDALAILCAHFASALRVKAITTVYGNQTIEKTTRNACALVDLLNAKTPVYQGASRPLGKEPLLAVSHGETGLGGYRQTGHLRLGVVLTQAQTPNAVQFLAESIAPGMRIACLGPTTNIGLLLNLYPNVLRQTDSVIIMGGVFDQPGNVSPWAEFNVYNDPEALQQVLAYEGVTKILIPADVCREVQMTEQDFMSMRDPSLAKSIREIVREYVEYYKHDHIHGGFSGGVMYDALVIAYMLWPELFHVEPRHVVVEIGNGPTRGATAVDLKRNDKPNCLLVTRHKSSMPLGVDASEVKRRLLQLLM